MILTLENKRMMIINNHLFAGNGKMAYIPPELRGEVNRFVNGIYELPAWLLVALPLSVVVKSIPHVPRKSSQSPSTIMVLRKIDPARGAIYQPMKIGKLVRSALPDMDPQTISDLVSRYKAERETVDILTAVSSLEIARVYRLSGSLSDKDRDSKKYPSGSCMGGSGYGGWGQIPADKSPAHAYGDDSGIHCAYIEREGTILARALFSDKNHSFSTVYGDHHYQTVLYNHLIGEGYSVSDCWADGHTLNRVNTIGGGDCVIPYLDGHGYIDADTLLISEDGNTNCQSSYAEPYLSRMSFAGQICDCCGERVDDEEAHFHDGSVYCSHDCLIEAGYEACEHCGEIYHGESDDAIIAADRSHFCSSYCAESAGYSQEWMR